MKRNTRKTEENMGKQQQKGKKKVIFLEKTFKQHIFVK